jgi:hypothetical protein
MAGTAKHTNRHDALKPSSGRRCVERPHLFFPDRSPSPRSKDGEKHITIDKLKLSVVR